MAGIERTPESAVIRRLKRFRDKYLMSLWNDTRNVQHPGNVDENTATGCNLNILPVDVQFRIMALLTPQDLCRLGSTSYYWRSVVRDPLLWKYFLLRDMPLWPSIDHASMPHLEALEAPLCKDEEDPSQDFMADYLRGSPACRRQWQPPRPAYKAVASFLQSLVVPTEPRFAMFGPGLEQLDVSLLEKLMFSPDVLPVAGIPQRQIGGIGSGISFTYNDQHRFNILTLYSTNRTERERARIEHQSVQSKLFVQDDSNYSITPQVQEVCRAVDGFIYAANAEAGRDGERHKEEAQIRAMLDEALGSSSRPILVLSCMAREEPGGARTRTPCVTLARQLNLQHLANPWMVQDTVAESLSGLLDGIAWLLKVYGLRL
ncbi:F-box only protein 4 isoform X1 [Brienomyrus brachyistius]|uniref:F-box only protein 4 isoform X1 n=2 Tax=Brienomyrus brachyistius TaxID=42636 RepID=UPI0020B3CEE4|nr:F-box only protein 4 isoform X1 [Brienomyrus brachyistius]